MKESAKKFWNEQRSKVMKSAADYVRGGWSRREAFENAWNEIERPKYYTVYQVRISTGWDNVIATFDTEKEAGEHMKHLYDTLSTDEASTLEMCYNDAAMHLEGLR